MRRELKGNRGSAVEGVVCKVWIVDYRIVEGMGERWGRGRKKEGEKGRRLVCTGSVTSMERVVLFFFSRGCFSPSGGFHCALDSLVLRADI